LVHAARRGDVAALGALLDRNPNALAVRVPPYQWSLLHVAAQQGHLAAVDLLLRRGIDPNTRERGDNTCPMHWAAAGGWLDVVRRLIEAGGDVIGHGDDHELEVIGWACCWEGCDDEAHRAVVDLLLRHGARHHIFSAVALGLPDEVRRLVAANPEALTRRMSRNENNATPLHFAVRMRRPEMVALLIELGADPLAVDASGFPVALYATTPEIDRPVMARIHAMTAAELRSANRGTRPARGEMLDLLAALSLGDPATAERLVDENPRLLESSGTAGGALHVSAKRGDADAVHWLLAHGASPNALWAHWDSNVTPLHLAVLGNHPTIVRLLLAAGADPAIRDSKHDSSALGWAEFFGRQEVIKVLRPHGR
jgi:ankyrin repeat protein